MRKGYKLSEETKRKMSVSKMGHKGYKYWLGKKREMPWLPKYETGHIPWNKGTKGVMKAWNKGKKGLQTPWNKGLKGYGKGHTLSQEARNKLSKSHKGKHHPYMVGEKNSNWKGGVTELTKKARNSLEYKIWREAVFARDNWTCVECKQRGGNMEADHIKPWSLFPDLRFAIDNGRTLCVSCHKKTDTWGYKLNIWKQKQNILTS